MSDVLLVWHEKVRRCSCFCFLFLVLVVFERGVKQSECTQRHDQRREAHFLSHTAVHLILLVRDKNTFMKVSDCVTTRHSSYCSGLSLALLRFRTVL